MFVFCECVCSFSCVFHCGLGFFYVLFLLKHILHLGLFVFLTDCFTNGPEGEEKGM